MLAPNLAPARPVQIGDAAPNQAAVDELRRLRREDPQLAAVLDAQAWRAGESRNAARVLGAASYRLPPWPAPSLDTRERPRRQVPGRNRKRLDPGVKARQRDRYKRAAADAIEGFARPHLRRDPRAGLWRPRWLDHRHDCHSAYCRGCAGIPVQPGPRWRRRGRRRDYLEGRTISVPEWLLDRAAAMRSCREAIALRDASCGGTLIVPRSCDVRTCPDCEAGRQTRTVERYHAAVTALDPDRVRFLTLTLRNADRGELAAAVGRLADSLLKLKRRAIWKGGRCRDRARCRMALDPTHPGWRLPHPAVTADMTSLEVTYNRERRTWHPHAHVLLESPAPIDQAELADTWLAITGDSFIVHIESVRRHADEHWGGDVTAALRELLKYAAKPSPGFLAAETDPGVLAELLVALRGRHLTSTAGKLYGRHLEDEAPEADMVLVPADDPRADPIRAPRICPLCGQPGVWSLVGHVNRSEARPVVARAGPYHRALALLSGNADRQSLPADPTVQPAPTG